MKRDLSKLLARLPSGLTFTQVSRRLRVNYLQAFRAAHKYGYQATDARHLAQRHRRKLNPELVDWRKPNIQIARELLVSRQLVSMVRHRDGIALSSSTRRRNFHNGKRSNTINHPNKHTKSNANV